MRKTKRLSLLLAFVLVLTLIISGCGKKQTTTSNEQVNLTFLCWGSTSNMEIRKKVVDEFEKNHPHIKITTIHVPLNFEDKLQTMIAGGSAPDVFWLDPTIQMPSFAEKGVLLDLGPLIEEDQQLQQNLDSYHKVALDSGVYKGITYGLPWVYNPEALFYNKKIIAEAGLAVPDGDFTISDLIEAAKKMVKKSKEGRVEQYGFGGGNWYGFVWRFGGEIFDDHDYPTKCTLDSPESIEGLQFYQDLVYKEKVSPTPAASKALPTEEMFTTGRLGMIAAGGWVVPKFKEISAFEWGSTNMPKGKRQVSAAWSTLTVASANTKHPKEAWEFIKFYASKTAQEICLKGGISTIPVLKMSTTPKTTEQTQGVFLSAQDGKMWPMLPQYAKIMDKINSELDYLIMNKHDATKVARNMVKNVNPILSSK